MLDYLIAHGWSVQMPNGEFSTTFMGRPDQQLALLQVGRHVNPKYEIVYTAFAAANAPLVIAPIRGECQDTYGSYFKFNLDYITFFNLVRLEPPGSPNLTFYNTAYMQLRQCTAKHQNAPRQIDEPRLQIRPLSRKRGHFLQDCDGEFERLKRSRTNSRLNDGFDRRF